MSAVRTQTLPVPLLLTPQKAADFVGIGRTSLLALLKAGKVKAKLDNGRRYFVTASLVAHIATLQDA
jgi:predicted site-specific integrase-resolvase